MTKFDKSSFEFFNNDDTNYQADTCVGVIVDTITIGLTFDGRIVPVEFAIQPHIISRGLSDGLWPGVTYNPEIQPFNKDWPDFAGEVIAYAINEGKTIADVVDEIEDADGYTFPAIAWQVYATDILKLRFYGIID